MIDALIAFFAGVYADDHFWEYVSMPFITALVSWATNWIAIQMTFYPTEYVGKRPFGWQGVVPARARKFGLGLVENTIEKLGGLDMLVDAIDRRRIIRHMEMEAVELAEDAINQYMRENHKLVWENLPSAGKAKVYEIIEAKIQKNLSNVIHDTLDHSGRYIDLKELVVSKMEQNKPILKDLLFSVAGKEINFVIHSGLFFGFLFGIVQAFAWILFPTWWTLPFFGFLAGATTNWLAIQLIFRPLEPIKVGPLVFQGLFLKRQREIAKSFCDVFTSKLLTVEVIVENMMQGASRERFLGLMHRHISHVFDDDMVIRTLAQFSLGPSGYVEMKEKILDTTVLYGQEIFHNSAFNIEQSRYIAEAMEEKIAVQPPEDFQNLARPIFSEDEWILIAVGGTLGGLAGWGQLVILFSDRLIALAKNAAQLGGL